MERALNPKKQAIHTPDKSSARANEKRGRPPPHFFGTETRSDPTVVRKMGVSGGGRGSAALWHGASRRLSTRVARDVQRCPTDRPRFRLAERTRATPRPSGP